MGKGEIYVGPAGWSYKDWEGIVYPRDRRISKDRLIFLSRFFSCIEINSTFYRIPTPQTTENWARKIQPSSNFLFTVKLWRGFTHGEKENFTKKLFDKFYESAKPLQETGRFGALLVQFPWFFRPSDQNRDRLARIAEAFPGLPLVLEVRNRQWADPGILKDISSLGYSFCNIDQPMDRDSMGPSSFITGPVGYVRFHGRNRTAWFSPDSKRDEKYDYLYDKKELMEWIRLISKIRSRVSRTFVITNNHYKGKAVVNALELKATLDSRRVEVPQPLINVYSRLAEVAQVGSFLFNRQVLGDESR